jgi:hypothetical protein
MSDLLFYGILVLMGSAGIFYIGRTVGYVEGCMTAFDSIKRAKREDTRPR